MEDKKMSFLDKMFGPKRSEKENSMTKKCHVCGVINSQEVKFCKACGSQFVIVYDRYDAFISYRRETGSDLASLLKIQLENNYHKQIFLDIKELQVGRFDEALLRYIGDTPNFILILSKGSLDRCEDKSDWLKREIIHALKTDRNIIPLLIEGFTFPSDDKWALLPPEMRVLSSLNGITYSHIHQDSAIRQIALYMKSEIPRTQVKQKPQPAENTDNNTKSKFYTGYSLENVKPDKKSKLKDIDITTPSRTVITSAKTLEPIDQLVDKSKENPIKDESLFFESSWGKGTYVELKLIGKTTKEHKLTKKKSGSPMNLHISGTLALLPTSEGLRAFDVSNPKSPKFLSFIPAPYMSKKWVNVIGNICLVRGDTASIKLVDIKNPSNMKEIFFDNYHNNIFNNCGNGLLKYDSNILIDLCHSESCGVKVLDFSNQQEINKDVRSIGIIHFPAGSGTLFNDYLLIGSYINPQLRIVHLSRNEIKEIRTLTLENSDGCFLPSGMAAYNGLLYIFGKGLSSPRPQLAIYSLKNLPEELELEANFELPNEYKIMTLFGVQVFTSGNWLYYCDNDRVFVYDISRPKQPKVAIVKDGPFHVASIMGNIIYCGDDRNLWVFEIIKKKTSYSK